MICIGCCKECFFDFGICISIFFFMRKKGFLSEDREEVVELEVNYFLFRLSYREFVRFRSGRFSYVWSFDMRFRVYVFTFSFVFSIKEVIVRCFLSLERNENKLVLCRDSSFFVFNVKTSCSKKCAFFLVKEVFDIFMICINDAITKRVVVVL